LYSGLNADAFMRMCVKNGTQLPILLPVLEFRTTKHVRFGSLANIEARPHHVRFSPESRQLADRAGGLDCGRAFGKTLSERSVR
jgi:hypothetical protein